VPDYVAAIEGMWTGSLGTQRIGCPKCGVASGYTVIAVTVVIGLNVMS
jgi:hypothetical protein